jgi:hypothetical protein
MQGILFARIDTGKHFADRAKFLDKNIYVWVFRKMTLAFIHAAFPLLPYESACNSSGSMSTKRQ